MFSKHVMTFYLLFMYVILEIERAKDITNK